MFCSDSVYESSPVVSLALSPQADLLAGGYENGFMRVWLTSGQSLLSLRVAQKDGVTGMAIPPLQLLSEWAPHKSAIINGNTLGIGVK